MLTRARAPATRRVFQAGTFAEDGGLPFVRAARLTAFASCIRIVHSHRAVVLTLRAAPRRSSAQTYISDAVTRNYGWEPGEYVGRDFLKMHIHADDVADIRAAFADAKRRADASGCAAQLAVKRRLQMPDGSWEWVSAYGCVQGATWLLVCKSLQAQVEQEAALRSLLQSVSRELRTPAQSGLAASELLARRDSVSADSEAAFLVRAIAASCRLLLGMVSNALSMRTIEAGQLDTHPAPFDPRAALHDLLQVCRLGCADARLVWANADEPLPATVTADRTFFSQILQNLVRARRRARQASCDAASHLTRAPHLYRTGDQCHQV